MKTRISGFVTIKNDWAVQSFGFKKYLPIGKPEIVVENLSRWGADEIYVNCIDSSKNLEGPNIKILRKIYKRKINTPIIYSGGIRNLSDAKKVINEGADRIAINTSAFNKNPNYFLSISNFLGSQALILCCTFIKKKQKFFWYNYISQKIKEIKLKKNNFKDNIFSELLLIDVKNEGYEKFDYNVLKSLDYKIPKILFGGVNPNNFVNKIKKFNIQCLSFGNRLHYKEIKIRKIRKSFNIFRNDD